MSARALASSSAALVWAICARILSQTRVAALNLSSTRFDVSGLSESVESHSEDLIDF